MTGSRSLTRSRTEREAQTERTNIRPEIHNFKIGDRVTVFSRQLGGMFVIEGRAKIVYV